MVTPSLELIESIKKSTIFSNLNDDEIKSILLYCTEITLNKNDLLFHQGDESDSVYILTSGKLSAHLNTNNAKHPHQWVGNIYPGESIGELGVLSSHTRSLNIVASTESSLLEISKNDFLKISMKQPAILFSMIKILCLRSQNLIYYLEKKNKINYVALVFLVPEHLAERVCDYFKHHITQQQKFISESDSDNSPYETLLSQYIAKHQLMNEGTEIFYAIHIKHERLLTTYLQYANKIYLFSDTAIELPIALQQILSEKHKIEGIICDVVHIHQSPEKMRNHFSNMYNKPYFSKQSHHLRLTMDQDYKRILRHMNGQSIGLVLGGGGVKSWVHIGVLRALEELSIPVDMIAGSSSGALAAACYAFSNSLEETIQRFTSIMSHIRNPFKLTNLTWPAVSLFSGKTGTEEIYSVFKETRIEDLPINFFCTSSNLTTNSETIHIEGLLWEKLRASISIPGILPPCVLNKELHIDGGLTNNLPVENLRELLGKKSKIIAVKISSPQEYRGYHFPPILTFKELLKFNLGLSSRNEYLFPPFMEVFLHSLLVGTAYKEKKSCSEANYLIAPDTRNYNMLGISEEQEKELITLGYNHGKKILSDFYQDAP